MPCKGVLNQRLENKVNQRTCFENNNADKAAVNHARSMSAGKVKKHVVV